MSDNPDEPSLGECTANLLAHFLDSHLPPKDLFSKATQNDQLARCCLIISDGTPAAVLH